MSPFSLRRRRRLTLGLVGGLAIGLMAPAVGVATAASALDLPPMPISLWHDLPMADVSGGSLQMTTGADGDVWYQDRATDHLVRIDLITHAQTDYDLSGRVWIAALTSTPDGRIWFSDTFSGSIGSLDPASGAVESFPLVGFGRAPVSLAVGADGNIWFGDPFIPQLGRLTPAGVLSAFPDPTDRPTLRMVADHDGTLWFTRNGADAVGSYDPMTGVFGETGVAPGSGPELTVSRAGDVWVAGQDVFSTIAPDGSVTIHPVSAPGPAPVVVTAMTGGVFSDVYFLDQEHGFGTIDAAGDVAFSRLDGTRNALTLDGDGHVWVNNIWDAVLNWQ